MTKTKKIIAALLLVIVCTTGLLAGCGKTPVEEADLDRIATYYFNAKLGEGTWTEWSRDDDTVVNAKEAFCMTAETTDGAKTYTIAVLKDGSGVYNYGIATGKANRIGGSEVGK